MDIIFALMKFMAVVSVVSIGVTALIFDITKAWNVGSMPWKSDQQVNEAETLFLMVTLSNVGVWLLLDGALLYVTW